MTPVNLLHTHTHTLAHSLGHQFIIAMIVNVVNVAKYSNVSDENVRRFANLSGIVLAIMLGVFLLSIVIDVMVAVLSVVRL